jgi:hypothetical protein
MSLGGQKRASAGLQLANPGHFKIPLIGNAGTLEAHIEKQEHLRPSAPPTAPAAPTAPEAPEAWLGSEVESLAGPTEHDTSGGSEASAESEASRCSEVQGSWVSPDPIFEIEPLPRPWQYYLEVQKCIFQENETEKYPLEVFFALNGSAAASDALMPFEAGISVGSGTASAAFVIAHGAIKYQWHLRPSFATFAPNVLKRLRLTISWEPAGHLTAQIQKSVHSKIQAAARQRPTVIQMHYAPQP